MYEMLLSMKAVRLVVLVLLCYGCAEEPKTIAPTPVAATPPPRETQADYWLSHPSVVLLSAKYGVGVDTIMAIVYDFNGLYRSGQPGYLEQNDHTVSIKPMYTGAKGSGPSPSESHAFFMEQAKQYNLSKSEVAEIISAVYSQGNRFTPKD